MRVLRRSWQRAQRRKHAALGPTPPALTRGFWGDVSGLLGRLSVSPPNANASEKPTNAAGTTAAVPATMMARAPRTEDDLKAVRELVELIRRAKTPAQLTSIWDLLAQRAPVEVQQGDEIRLAIGAAAGSRRLRMLDFPTLVRLAHENQHHRVIERWHPQLDAARTSTSDSARHRLNAPALETHVAHRDDDDDCVLLGDTFVAGRILTALGRLGDHGTIVDLYERLEAERREFRAIAPHLLPPPTATAADDTDPTLAFLRRVVELGPRADAMYIAALGHLKAHKKLLERCEARAGDLGAIIHDRNAFRGLLHACMAERRGALARAAIDQAHDGFPLTTFSIRLYALALKANLGRDRRDPHRLRDALHIFRRMHHEVGYIVAPPEWSMLFNACVYEDDAAGALEVFGTYRQHGIEAFGTRFQQALRTACRFERFDMVLEMMAVWMRLERESTCEPPNHGIDEDTQDATEGEVESFNRVLWEMLKREPTIDQVTEVLRAMERRRIPGGALVVRRIVSRFLRPEDDMTSASIVQRFLSLWERCPNVIQRTSFVLYLIIEACESNDWCDECESILEYGVAQGMELPLQTAIKVMDGLSGRGRFDQAIQVGELVLRRPSSMDVRSLPDVFFESLLKSYLLSQRFEDILRLDDELQLQDHFPLNAVIAATVRDAKSMV